MTKPASSMSGFPEHGDPYPQDDPVDPPAPAPADPPAPEPSPQDREIADLKARLTKQQEDLDQLRRATPPPTPKTPVVQEDDPLANIEEELYRNPKEALQKFGEKIRKDVTRELTGQYQRDRGTQKFWEDFYGKHPDLKQDHDLVDLTLQSNLAEMSSMTVPKAMDHLADLTRDRILRYAGGAGKPRAPKARAEGGQPPAPPPPRNEEPKVLTISEIIKRRKGDRRKAAGV